jgi:hypothetical protein
MATQEKDAEGSLAILCSCDEGQQAREIPQCRQGLFSVSLLNLLTDSLSASQEVALSDVFERTLATRMGDIAAKYGFTIRQRPWIQRSGRPPVLITGTSPTMAGASTGSDVNRDENTSQLTESNAKKCTNGKDMAARIPSEAHVKNMSPSPQSVELPDSSRLKHEESSLEESREQVKTAKCGLETLLALGKIVRNDPDGSRGCKDSRG